MARETTEAFLKQILSLPREAHDDGTYIQLPEHPIIKLPREMPALAAKPKTRWQKYAETKQIGTNKKREKLVWDDVTKSWRPRHGRFSTRNNVKTPIIELKPQDEKNFDPFQDMEEKKGKHVKREKFKAYRNRAERIKQRK